MLRLIVNSPASSEAVIPVRWCLDKEAVQRLSERGALDPQIVISITNGGQEVDRVVVPVDQAMAYVEFHKPGVNTLNAFIAWHRKGQTKVVKAFFLERRSHRGVFEGGLIDYEDGFSPLMCDWTMREHSITWLVGDGKNTHTASLDVYVPKEFFAAEPSEREKRWVNLWYRHLPADQCEYRRRRIWAYTLKPFAVLLYVISDIATRTAIAAFTLLMGLRVASFAAIVRPLNASAGDVWNHWDGQEYFDRRHSFILTDKQGNNRPFGFGLLHPLNFLSLAGIIYGASRIPARWAWPAFGLFLGLTFMATGVLVFICLYHLVEPVVRKLAKKVRVRAKTLKPEPGYDAQERAERERKEREKEVREIAFRQRMSEVACSATPMKVDVRALRRPSVTLRFQALKAKVCRPYVS